MAIVEHQVFEEDIFSDDHRFEELCTTEFAKNSLQEGGPGYYIWYLTIKNGILIGVTLNYYR